VNVESTFELHAKSLAKAAKCISHCFSLIVAIRLFPQKWINQQSSYRAIYRYGIAILPLPYLFIEGAAQKSSCGSEWVRLRTDFQRRAN
jgi:hypothetical protein